MGGINTRFSLTPLGSRLILSCLLILPIWYKNEHSKNDLAQNVRFIVLIYLQTG